MAVCKESDLDANLEPNKVDWEAKLHDLNWHIAEETTSFA